MSELSARANVPVPTIKYYVREGLLHPGKRTSPNQAEYNELHVRRLRLIRALVDVGNLPIAATRTVLACLDAPGIGSLETLGKVQYTLTTPRPQAEEDDGAWQAASHEVSSLIERHGWLVQKENPARHNLTEVLATLRRLGQDDFLDALDDYATAAKSLAGTEVELVWARAVVDEMAEGVIIAAVLGDALLAALRRLAQEDQSVRRIRSLAPLAPSVGQVGATPADGLPDHSPR